MELSGRDSFPIIENVWVSYFTYLWHKRWWLTLLLLSLLVGASYVSLFYPSTVTDVVVLAIIVFALGFFASAYIETEGAFMRQFAERNGFIYKGSILTNSEIGSLFSQGKAGKGEHAIKGEFLGRPFHFFYYSYTAGAGRSQHKYYFTVFDFEFQNKFPRMYVDARKGFDMAASWKRRGLAPLSLESNEWNRKFSLYITPGTQITALQIFTPDVMHDFLNLTKPDDVEIIANQLYIYHTGKIKTKKELEGLHSLSKHLVENITHVLEGVKV